ncbi:SDR family oxidoreductase [Sinomonas sp. JGH33]|uniref:SDR family oxidoreductase n=1 Tax=Sinomonas terricola TaxID=3110330 RepID=A0ABU5TC50_9MICC|nr:SDR family oxidoreductase [Sinomonas sp. JGH33]MEA5457267.1 SDR family oxidoreductase [Sinomonas sp. JGH33]
MALTEAGQLRNAGKPIVHHGTDTAGPNRPEEPGKVCLVTGGGGPHVGWGICEALAQHGYHVVVADRSLRAAEGTVARLAGLGHHQATAVAVDVANTESVESCVGGVLARLGRIDGLVNSAGVGLDSPLTETTPEQFDRLMHVNVRGALWCARAVAPAMAEAGGGSIVNIGSVHARNAAPGYGLYAATKAALVAMSRALATELGPDRIRCNVVHPGAVRQEGDLDPVTGDPEVRSRHLAFADTRQILHCPVRPIDVGNAVAFLVSDSSRMVTGTELMVDGGTTALLHDLNPTHD